MLKLEDLSALWPFVCLVLLPGSAIGQGPSFYCSRNSSNVIISGESVGDIYTLYEGDTHYQNNQKCVWTIDAGEGYRTEITVMSSSLQWAPEVAICHGYDHVNIKDVSTATIPGIRDREESEELIVLIWCGLQKPLGAVSSGRYLRVEFMSDKNNPYQYTGVHLKFQTFASTDCAPSWATPPGGDVCFKLLGSATDWPAAQKACNAEHSNLASFTSDDEFNFVVQTYKPVDYGLTTWIGLNDREDPGTYKWVDKQRFTVSKFPAGHQSDEFQKCVALHFELQEYRIHDCQGYKSRPLCKANRGRHTELFAVPQEPTDEDDLPSNYLVVIGVCIGILVILVIIGIIVFRYVRAKRARSPRRQKAQQPAAEVSNTTSRSNTTTRLSTDDDIMTQRYTPGSRLMDSGSAGGSTGLSSGGQARPSAPPLSRLESPPGAPPPSSQMVAPPAYDDIILNPQWASRI